MPRNYAASTPGLMHGRRRPARAQCLHPGRGEVRGGYINLTHFCNSLESVCF